MVFFDSASSDEMTTREVNELQKVLGAGYGTDSVHFTGGHVLIPENLELEVVSVVSQLKEDYKVMNTVKKTPVQSTVPRNSDSYFLTVPDGGQSLGTNQSFERKPFLVMLFGALEVRAPKSCGLVKNIAYTGGLY